MSANLTYVFGYGSLMHLPGIRETISGYDEAASPVAPAYLRGFRRGFTAVFKNTRQFSTETGGIPEYIAYMNVEQQADATALGVIFRVDSHQLQLLDLRENGYERINVSGKITLPASVDFEIPADSVLFTYSADSSGLVSASRGKIAIGLDYESIIAVAHRRIDVELGGNEFASDYENVLNRFRDWPRVVRSNSRTDAGYQ